VVLGARRWGSRSVRLGGGDRIGDGVGLVGDGVGLVGDGVGLVGDGVGLVGDGVGLVGDGVGLVGDGIGLVNLGHGTPGSVKVPLALADGYGSQVTCPADGGRLGSAGPAGVRCSLCAPHHVTSACVD